MRRKASERIKGTLSPLELLRLAERLKKREPLFTELEFHNLLIKAKKRA